MNKLVYYKSEDRSQKSEASSKIYLLLRISDFHLPTSDFRLLKGNSLENETINILVNFTSYKSP